MTRLRTHRPHWLPTTITFADVGEGDGVRWLHALASVDTEWKGAEVPLSDPIFFTQVYEELREQIEGADGQPPIHQPFYLVQHKHGPDADGLPPMNLGQFRKVRLATRAELAEQGLDVIEPLHIMLGVDLNRVGRALDAQDQLPNGSVGLHFGYDDHRRENGRGRRRLAWLDEFSATAKPYMKTLRSALDTARLQLSDEHGDDPMDREQLLAALQEMKANDPAGYAEFCQQMNAGETPDPAAEPKPPKPGAPAGLQASEPEGDGEPGKPETPPAAANTPAATPATAPASSTALELSERAELRSLRLEVQQLRAAPPKQTESDVRRELLEMCERDQVLVTTPDGKVDEEYVDSLVSLKLSDEAEFERLYPRLGRATLRATERQAAGGPKVPTASLEFSESPSTPEEVAANRRLADEYASKHNVTYSEALSALRKQQKGA